MDKKILFVWDFHGTLEKGNIYAVQELINLVLKDFGINKEISLKETNNWYGLSWFDYFKLITPEGNSELWQSMVNKVLSLQERGWNIIKNHIEPREFAEEVLRTIKKRKHDNILLTNAQPEHANKFVELIGLTDYLDKIVGVDTPYNSRINNAIHDVKAENLTNFIKDKNYKKIVVIGDKESDIKAGRNCGAITYLFIPPENNENIKNTEADYIIHSLRGVLKELKS